MTTNPLYRLADLWIGRKTANGPARDAARKAVEHLKPSVVVTGGSRGIGAALAYEFARVGWDVAIIARGKDALDSTANELRRKTGRTVLALPLDVTIAGAAETIDAELAERGFYLDILVNNAALGLSGGLASHSGEDLDRLVVLNIAAPLKLMRQALGPMLARERGGILNIASLGGYAPGPYQAAYYASKAFMLSVSEAAAAETAGRGVRITALAPGPVNTGFHASMGAEDALYRRLVPPLSPERTAHIACRNYFFGRRLIVPGVMNFVMFAALRLLPHPISVPLIAQLLKPRGARPPGADEV